MIGAFLCWVAEKSLLDGVCILFVCPSIFAHGAQTDDRIVTGEAPFDAPERLEDDDDNRRVISIKLHVSRASA